MSLMKWEHTGTLKKEELSRMLRSMADALDSSNEFQSFIGSTKLSMEASDTFSIAVQLVEENNKYSFGLSLAWVKPSSKTQVKSATTQKKMIIDDDAEVVRTVRGARRKKRPSILGSKAKIPVPTTKASQQGMGTDVLPHVTEEPTAPPTPPTAPPTPTPQEPAMPEPESQPEPAMPEPELQPEPAMPEPPTQPTAPPTPTPQEPAMPEPESQPEPAMPEPESQPEPTDWRQALDMEMESSGFIKKSQPEPQPTTRPQEVMKPTRIHQPQPTTTQPTAITYTTNFELAIGTYESAFTMKTDTQWVELDLSGEQLESIKYKKLAEEVLKSTPPQETPNKTKAKTKAKTKTSVKHSPPKDDKTEVEELFSELDEEPPKKKKTASSGIDESSHLVKPSEYLKRKNK